MKTADEILRDANRISEFLRDPVIAEALSRFERRNYEALLVADTPEKRVRVHVMATIIRDFEIELKSCLDAGEIEVKKAAQSLKQS